MNMAPLAVLENVGLELELRDRDADSIFREICQRQGLTVTVAEARLLEFKKKPSALPWIVHKGAMSILGIATD